jgi:hypothetical protein
MPVRPETLNRLEALAEKVSRIVQHRVEPLQVAAVLIERDLENLSASELVAVMATGRSRSG